MKLTLVLVLWLFAVLWAGAARAESPALVLTQTSAYLGKQVMYLTPTQVALKSDLANIVLRVKEDRIVIYNDKKKCYVDKSYTQWAKRVGGLLASNPNATLAKSDTPPICGWKCFLYRLEPKKGAVGDHCEFYVTQDSKLPAATLAAVAKFGDFPQGVGLPLRAVKILNGRRVNGLDTTKIERKAVPASLFKLPTGYRKVDDEVEVLLAEEDEGMDGLLDEAPTGRSATKAQKPRK